jgi:hypothetical protein
MSRWEEPLETSNGRNPWRYSGVITDDNTDRLRHHHCLYYDACLDDASRQCKVCETWACPANCLGRATYVEFPAFTLEEEPS